MNLLTNEQIAYLKSLESKKKRRKFFLDCLVENVLGESEKNNQDALVGIQKLSNSPRYLFPHEMEEIQRLNPSFTNTTVPRTFENRQEFSTEDYDFEKGFKESIEMRIPYDSTESKWSGNVKLEDIIKAKLIIRGFKNETLLNNRGLIGATIEETANEVKKCYESANEKDFSKYESYLIDESNHLTWMYNRLICVYGENPNIDYMQKLREIALSYNPEAKYTELDMVTSFYIGRQKQPRIVTETKKGITYRTDKSFDDWFQEFKKEKENDQSAN